MIEFVMRHLPFVIASLAVWAIPWTVGFCKAETYSFKFVLFILSGPIGWALISISFILWVLNWIYDLVRDSFEIVDSQFYQLEDNLWMWRRRQHKLRKYPRSTK